MIVQVVALRDDDGKQCFRVFIDNQITTPQFADKGSAAAYGSMILSGQRDPEFHNDSIKTEQFTSVEQIINRKVRWSIVMPKELHRKLHIVARSQKITIHEVIISYLEKMTEDVDAQTSLL